MNRISCFLNQENSIKLLDKTVGSLLKERQVEHLWSERTSPVDTVIIHHMSNIYQNPEEPFTAEELISILVTYEVSAHFLIGRDGTIHELVPIDKKAWHAGGSIMPKPDNRLGVNDFSIGIELAGGVDWEFTQEQYESLIALCCELGQKERIQAILGHEDIAGERAVEKGLRKDIKVDPGPKFDWELLREKLPQSLAQCIKHGN